MVTFYKFSTSLSYIDKMFYRKYQRYDGMFKGISLSVLVFCVTIWVLVKIYREKTQKLTHGLKENFKVYNDLDDKKKN